MDLISFAPVPLTIVSGTIIFQFIYNAEHHFASITDYTKLNLRGKHTHSYNKLGHSF